MNKFIICFFFFFLLTFSFFVTFFLLFSFIKYYNILRFSCIPYIHKNQEIRCYDVHRFLVSLFFPFNFVCATQYTVQFIEKIWNTLGISRWCWWCGILTFSADSKRFNSIESTFNEQTANVVLIPFTFSLFLVNLFIRVLTCTKMKCDWERTDAVLRAYWK